MAKHGTPSARETYKMLTTKDDWVSKAIKVKVKGGNYSIQYSKKTLILTQEEKEERKQKHRELNRKLMKKRRAKLKEENGS
jgi:murein L,D-transpeptidase YafK